jgi:hypothetical protein
MGPAWDLKSQDCFHSTICADSSVADFLRFEKKLEFLGSKGSERPIPILGSPQHCNQFPGYELPSFTPQLAAGIEPGTLWSS